MEVKATHEHKNSIGYQIIFENVEERKHFHRDINRFIHEYYLENNDSKMNQFGQDILKIISRMFSCCQTLKKNRTAITIKDNEIAKLLKLFIDFGVVNSMKFEASRDQFKQYRTQTHDVNLKNYIGFLEGMVCGLQGKDLKLDLDE